MFVVWFVSRSNLLPLLFVCCCLFDVRVLLLDVCLCLSFACFVVRA